MDKIKDWLEAIENSPLSIKKLLSSKKLASDAVDATIAYVMGHTLTPSDKKIFLEKVVPLLEEMDPTFTIKLSNESSPPIEQFANLDSRPIEYRFDLEKDIPWQASMTVGRLFAPDLLHTFGLDRTLQGHPAIREELEWSWALTICRAFDFFEKDIIQKLGDRNNRILPTKSSQLLIEEEVKHRKLFKRLGKILEDMHPERLELFNSCYQHPVCYEISYEDRKDLEVIEQHQYIIWLYTLFFEEFTVYLHECLKNSPETIQRTWLVAHACHRQEEQEHLRTGAAYLELCGLNHTQMRSLSKEFFFAFERNYMEFFGLGTCLRYTEAKYGGNSLNQKPLSSLPFFQEVLHHPLFEHTRTWAPVLQDLGKHPKPLESAPVVLRKEVPAHNFMQIYRENEVNLIHALSETARKFPKHGLHIQNQAGEWQLISYQELYDNARDLAARMSDSLGWSQFVLIYFPDIYHCLLGFWASLFAGRVPVVLAHTSSITSASEEARRLTGILASLDSPVILTDLSSKKDLEIFLESTAVPILTLEESLGRESKQKTNIEPDGDTPALLQFSSGSTGDPKGIVLSHRNIMANALQMIMARQGKHSDRFLNWMPLHHDMGLIGFHITPLILGADQYHILPFQFMKHPALWPTLVTRNRITHAGTTNTALKTLLRWGKAKSRDSYDLSSLSSVIIGAEPIEKLTLDEMTEVFAPLGLQKSCLVPAFGMAEAALGVSFLEHHKTYDTTNFDRSSLTPGGRIQELASDQVTGLALVNLGKAVMDLELRIVDEEGRTLPEGFIGYLCVRGPNVSAGYWSRQGYHRLLNSEGWFQTQDIGFLLRQCFYTVGRLQELFFNSGKNYYLNDVDSVVEQLTEIRPGGCATIVNPEGSQQASDLIAFVDLIHSPDQDVQVLLEKVYRHINQRMGVAVGRVVGLSRRHFMKTTSGKLKRWDMYRSWASGNWQDSPVFVPQAKTTAKIESKGDDSLPLAIAKIWSDILEQDISQNQWDTSFSEFGGTSLKAVRVHDALEQLLAKPLDPSWLLSMNSIRQQADAIREAGLTKAEVSPESTIGQKPSSLSPRTQSGETSQPLIAIVGVGLRYPEAHNLTEFSQIMFEGKQNFKALSDKRCRLIGWNPTSSSPQDRPYGSFLEDIDKFDARLFGLSPGLAEDMDPQQRILLEIAHMALAQTRITSNRLGVFVSSGDNEYEELIRHHRPLDEDALIGALTNMVAAQISRAWHFHGPALKVDSACSSSLYAVHLACQALKLGECDAALAGGIQINLTTKGFSYFKAAGLLKQTATPAPFSDQPSGLVPGEGGGLVVLKRYADALRDGDSIYALIRASATNNDGPSLSGTAPNPNGQIELLQTLYQKSAIRFQDLDYLEAHAAGTTIGDSIEVRALQTAFNLLDGKSSHRIALGSSKLFFGHCLSASGITSLLKVLASLEQSRMPTSLLNHKSSARIDFAAGNFHPLEKTQAWNQDRGVRRAGINSLGLGGTNVHMIVEDPPRLAPVEKTVSALPTIISVGGNSPDHYQRRFHEIKKSLPQMIRENPGDLTRASVLSDQFASVRRLFWSQKTATLPEMMGENASEVLPKIPKNRPRIAFIYPGPGCQYPHMGQFLYESVPSFRIALDDCHSRLKKLGFDLLITMFDKNFESELMKIENSQPVVFSFSYALSRFLEELGVEPDLVLGHSAGEYAAAVQAGLMDLDSALRGILQRGRLMAASPLGGMAVVHLPFAKVQTYLHEFKNFISIAAMNSPEQTTVSGDPQSLDQMIERLERDGHQASRLDISCAAHSPAMQSAAMDLKKAFAGIPWTPGKTLFISTAVDTPIHQLSAEYWAEQLVRPVYFSRAIEKAIALGVDIFLELSPTSGLSSCISEIDQAQNRSSKISLLRRGQDSFEHTLNSFNSLYSRGVPLRLETLIPGGPHRDLWNPVFLQQSFWVKLEAKKTEPDTQKNIYLLQTDDLKTMHDHLIQGRASAPFGLLMDVLLNFQGSTAAFTFKDLVFLNSLYADSAKGIRIHRDQNQIELHALGTAGEKSDTFLAQTQMDPMQKQVFHKIDVDLIRHRCQEHFAPELIYERRHQSGLAIGPSLRAIKDIFKGDQELLVYLESSEQAAPGKLIQAALIDSAMQATSALFPAEEQKSLYLGFGIELWQSFHPIQKECLVYIRLNNKEGLDDIFKFDILFADLQGTLLSQMQNFTVKKRDRPQPSEAPVNPPPAKAERSESLETVLYGIFSKHLHRTIGFADLNELFSTLGVDSLKAVRIAGEIQNHFKIKLPATLLFECPNLKALIRELERRIP